MSISGVILNPNVYSSNQTTSNNKVVEGNRSGKVDINDNKEVKADTNYCFQGCGTLTSINLSRSSSTQYGINASLKVYVDSNNQVKIKYSHDEAWGITATFWQKNGRY